MIPTITKSAPLLLGELYRFPTTARISQYLRIHHLTLASANKVKIDEIAKILNQAKGQSARDLSNVIERVDAPVKTFLPALIDCANASSIWQYTPSKADEAVLKKMGWKV